MTTTDHTWLITLISRQLSGEEVLDLCLTLNVEKENFHDPAADFPRQLVAEVARQGRLPALIEQCIRLRPGAERWTPQAAVRRHLPFARNPAFTGRAALLNAIHSSLVTHHSSLVTHHSSLILVGLGGVGKTQVALEYAYRHQEEYDVIGWLSAANAEALALDYVALGRRLGLPVDAMAEQAAQIELVRQWLAQTEETWLLVFDNADTLAPDDLRPYLPQRRRGHLFITSRSPDWGRLGRALPLDVFTEEEAAAFWAQRLGSVDQEEAAKLAEALGRLPLALEHAAAYAGETGCTLARYHHLFKTTRQKLWEKAKKRDEYPATITTTWQIAFEKIKEQPAALALFNLCCFLAPEGIPLALLREHSDTLPPELAAAAGDELELDAAITPLRRYALAARDGDMLALHRLVQTVARDRLPPELAQQWAEAAIKLLRAAWPFDQHNMVTWPAAAALLPHLLAALQVTAEINLETEQVASLHNSVAFYLHPVGQYKLAHTHMQRALTIDEKALGPDHPNVATLNNNLGLLLQAMGDLGRARPYYDRALAIWEKALGPDHPQVATGNNNLGMLLQAMGDLGGARPYLDRALALSEKALGPDHPDVAIGNNNLGGLLQDMGDLGGARPYFDRALAISEKALGPDHPNVAAGNNNLGVLLQAMGDLGGARPYLDRALAISEKALGPDHPQVATGNNNLGMLLQAMGDVGGARPYLDHALAIDEKALGPDHPDVARDLNNLGLLLQAMGDLGGARPYLDRALAIDEKALGPDHPNVAIRLNNLGTLLQDMGDLGGAREYLQRALAILEAKIPNHPNTQTVRRNLAGVAAQIR